MTLYPKTLKFDQEQGTTIILRIILRGIVIRPAHGNPGFHHISPVYNAGPPKKEE